MVDISSTGALKAYSDAVKRAQGMESGSNEGAIAPSGSGGNFSDMVRDVIDNTISQSQKAEEASMQAVAGGGDPLDVVTAITSAEVTLQTVVTVRDKIISAYQEIIRMPI